MFEYLSARRPIASLAANADCHARACDGNRAAKAARNASICVATVAAADVFSSSDMRANEDDAVVCAAWGGADSAEVGPDTAEARNTLECPCRNCMY